MSKTDLNSSKLYGCGVAKLDTYDSDRQFGDTTVNYLKFASEIFIRKKDGGWKINTRIDNSSGSLIYQHLLTHYKKGSGNGLIADEISLIEVEYENSDKFSPATDISLPNLSGNVVSLGSELLTIKLPSETDSWYLKNNYLLGKSWTTSSPALTKTHQTTKEWSGIWIEDSTKSSQEVFQDIEVFIKDMSYSQVFCKGSSCGNGARNKVYKVKASEEGFSVPQTWNKALDTTTKNLTNSNGVRSFTKQNLQTRYWAL